MAPSKSAVFFRADNEEDESISPKTTFENEAYKGYLSGILGNKPKSRDASSHAGKPIRYRAQQQLETRQVQTG